jgi:hypothetical protein
MALKAFLPAVKELPLLRTLPLLFRVVKRVHSALSGGNSTATFLCLYLPNENSFRQWRKFFYSPGWRSGYRAGLEIHIGTNRACAKDKPASGPLARRGSNPFPGAVFLSNFWAYFVKIGVNYSVLKLLRNEPNLAENFY